MPECIRLWGGVSSPADKVHLTPTEDIQDEAFIGIRELHILQGWGRGNVADATVFGHPWPPLGPCPDGPPCGNLVSVAIGQVQL